MHVEEIINVVGRFQAAVEGNYRKIVFSFEKVKHNQTFFQFI